MRPSIEISMVAVSIPIDASQVRRRYRREDERGPRVDLELARDWIQLWDCVNWEHCGDRYGLEKDLIEMPFFSEIHRYLAEQRAANRGNALGAFLTTVVDAMDAARAARDGSSVYFAQAGGRIKIGRSRKVGARLTQLQTGNPEPVALLATIPGGIALERQLHERFGANRVAGEWFEATPELKAYIASLRSAGSSNRRKAV